MKVRAELNYLRIAPRKVRLVSGLIRGMTIQKAEAELRFLPKRSSLPLLKLLKSAVANAEHNFNLEKQGLVISEIRVDQGPVLKRFRARAFGKAAQILKRTSHVSLVLESKAAKVTKEAKATNVAKTAEEMNAVNVVKETKVAENDTERTEKHSIRAAMKKERSGARQKTKGFVRRMFQRKAI